MMREAIGFAMRLARRSERSESQVAEADGEDSGEGVDAELRRGSGELADGGHGRGGARGRAGGGNCGPVGRTSGVDGRNGRRDRGVDGRCRVCDAGGGGAREGYGVDAVDGRGDIDGGVIVLRLRKGEERKERKDEGLEEGSHLGDRGLMGSKCMCCRWLYVARARLYRKPWRGTDLEQCL